MVSFFALINESFNYICHKQVNLLNKVLGIVAGVLLIDHDVRHTQFQQVPYHRIFIMLFLELNAPDAILENINFQVRHAYKS